VPEGDEPVTAALKVAELLTPTGLLTKLTDVAELTLLTTCVTGLAELLLVVLLVSPP
jgi:hypothetical protein